MWGLRPNARQIRETADCDMLSASAIERIDQCESPVGSVWPSVLATRASTYSSAILRCAPSVAGPPDIAPPYKLKRTTDSGH